MNLAFGPETGMVGLTEIRLIDSDLLENVVAIVLFENMMILTSGWHASALPESISLLKVRSNEPKRL